MLVCNLFGAPGSGKSTIAASVFSELKLKGINAELCVEFAKQLTWQKRFNTLKNQPYVFAKGLDKLLHLDGQVDVVVTDSPIFLSIVYATQDWPQSFLHSVVDIFNKFNNLNFFLNRIKPYNPSGRNQTENESDELAKTIKANLSFYNIPFTIINGDLEGKSVIVNKLMESLNEKTNLQYTNSLFSYM